MGYPALALSANEGGQTAAEDTHVASAGLHTGERVPSNVTDMPMPKGRVQDIVLNLLLKGNTLKEIAEVTGQSEDAVTKIIRSDWAAKQLNSRAAEIGSDDGNLRALIRVYTVGAIIQLDKFTRSTDEKVAVAACKTFLEWGLSKPNPKDKTAGKATALDPDNLKAELDSVEAEINRTKAQPKF